MEQLKSFLEVVDIRKPQTSSKRLDTQVNKWLTKQGDTIDITSRQSHPSGHNMIIGVFIFYKKK